MNYNLKSPCEDCPFRKDRPFPLNRGRSREIHRGISNDGFGFACHKTTTELGRDSDHPKAEHCAGALILAEKREQPHQMMRIMERIGLYDASKVNMEAPVYDSFEEMEEACAKRDGEGSAYPKGKYL